LGSPPVFEIFEKAKSQKRRSADIIEKAHRQRPFSLSWRWVLDMPICQSQSFFLWLAEHGKIYMITKNGRALCRFQGAP